MTYTSPISPVALGIHVLDNDGYYTATNVEEVLKEIQERRFQTLEAPTGFENRTDSDLYTVQPSYAAGPDELTVTVTHVNDFSIFVQGLEVIKTTTGTVVISAPAEGVYWIYYDSAGTLTASTVVFDFEDTTKVPVVVLYWDDDNSQVIYLGDERHGTVMDSSTHDLMHTTIGTRYQTGLTISGYALSTDSNAAVSVGVAAGMIHDEDVAIPIVDDATPDTYWEQDLSDPAKIPIFYRDGAAGNWRRIAATDYPFHPTGSGRLAYDNVGVGLAEGTNNYYIAYWIFATNDINNPIISIMGQRQDLKLVDAKANNTYESLAFGTLPFQEMKALYRIILQTKTVLTNAIKSTIEDVADHRALSTVATGTYVASSHSLLSDLSNDDHTQYLLADGTRALTGDWAVGAHAISGITTLGMTGQLTNTLAIGTPPFVITSTDKVVNLNVDMVDGYHLDQGVLIASTPTFGGLTINGAMLLNGVITGVNSIACDIGTSINEFSTDDTLAGDSDDAVPTEQAVKAYADVIQADVDGFNDELKDLTQVEIQQLELIDAVTISGAQWGYLGALDQALTQASSPTFVGLTLSADLVTTSTIDGVDVAGLKTDVDGFNDELKDLTQVEIQQLENIDATTIASAAWTQLSTITNTHVGLTGGQGLDTPSTEADWSNLAWLYSAMIHTSVGIDEGAPVDNYGYFLKVAQRDSAGGWAGLWIGYSADQNYFGRTATSAAYATWEKIAIHGTSLTLADVTVDSIITAGTVDGVDVSTLPALIAANTTVVEVENIIIAELVNGQSIDLAIDALINTHNAADTHIAHSGVTITAGVGLSGGGTIAANRTIDCDITQYTDADALAHIVGQNPLTLTNGLTIGGALAGVTTFSAGTATFEVAADGYITTYPGMVIGADNYVLTYDHALGTLVLEVAAVGGGESLAATLAIGNESDGTDIIIDSAGDLIVYSDDKVTEKARIDGATGNITTAGTVDGIDISAYIDQAVLQASSPTFVGLTLTGAIATPTTITTSGLITSGTGLQVNGDYIKSSDGVNMFTFDGAGKIGLMATLDCNVGMVAGRTIDTVDLSVFKGLYDAHILLSDVHHAQSHNVASHSDTTMTGAETEDSDMFESGNAAWVPMIFSGTTTYSVGVVVTSIIATQYLFFTLPIPTSKGTLKLYVDDIKYAVTDADGSNYIDRTDIYGVNAAGGAALANDPVDGTNRIAAAEITWARAATDVSSYYFVTLRIKGISATAGNLDFTPPVALCYYA